MGNTSPIRKAILDDDIGMLKAILKDAGDGAPDLINEDFTSDCFCNRARNVQPPLHTALTKGKIDAAKVLLEYGADVNAPGWRGQQNLHLVARQNSSALCRLLLEHDADIHGEDRDGKRPLHAAASSHVASRTGDVSSLRYLIRQTEASIDINHSDLDGNTPLHDAAFWGNVHTAQFLCSSGANILIPNNRGHSPLSIATVRHHDDLVKILKEFL